MDMNRREAIAMGVVVLGGATLVETVDAVDVGPRVLTVENTSRIGRPVLRIVDADGIEHNHSLRVDLDTGRITKMVVRDGQMVLDPGTRRAKTETITVKVPIQVTYIDPEKLKALGGCSLPGANRELEPT